MDAADEVEGGRDRGVSVGVVALGAQFTESLLAERQDELVGGLAA